MHTSPGGGSISFQNFRKYWDISDLEDTFNTHLKNQQIRFYLPVYILKCFKSWEHMVETHENCEKSTGNFLIFLELTSEICFKYIKSLFF